MKRFRITTMSGMIISLLMPGCASEQNGYELDHYNSPAIRSIAHSSIAAGNIPDTPRLPELTESSGLSDYLAYAALNNAGLEAAFNRWKAALEQVPQVKALPDPRFTYLYYIQEVETRVGPQRQGIGIAQVFPWFGKLSLRGDVAAEAANAVRKRYDVVKLKLFFEVKDAYYEYYYLAKNVAVTKENINLVKHLESVARSRYKASVGIHPDVIRAQVEIGKLEDRYQTLLDLRQPIVARLNAALNRPIEADIPWPSEINVQDVNLEDEDLLTELMAENPELKALDFEIDRNKHAIELAKKDYYPNFNLGLNFIDTGSSPVGNPPDDGKDPVTAMISINLPLWREKYDAGVREARARYYAARQDRTEKTNSLSSELKLASYRFRDAGRKIDLYGNALLPKARESLKATETGYLATTQTFTDLIDAQRIFLEFALAYERALTDHAQSLAKLEMLVGREIPRAGNENEPADANNKETVETREN
ncbi:MAG: TolC family protein [Planctomycetes bacterium]|nr:TolC family protein [Planctomycetota bacterium]